MSNKTAFAKIAQAPDENDLQSMSSKSGSSFSDIDMSRWKDYLDDVITDSLWILGAREKTGPHAGDYHGNFVPQIAYQVITRFTRQGEIVLDMFSGMGTTLIECSHLGRNGIGIELNPQVVEASKERISLAANPCNIVTKLIHGDSASLGVLSEIKNVLNNY